jgi:hypothetical protein
VMQFPPNRRSPSWRQSGAGRHSGGRSSNNDFVLLNYLLPPSVSFIDSVRCERFLL